MPLHVYAERCAQELAEIYNGLRVSTTAFVEQEVEPWGPARRGAVSIFVKSVREPSVDEIPIIAAIIGALGDRKILVYEYERISPAWEPRERVLARLVRASIERGEPSIIVMPSALPVGLYGSLPEEAVGALQESTTIRAVVEHENILYLPRDPPLSGVEIVAKRNSTASYGRVVWLEGEASRRGVRVRGVRYLSDNTQIFSYVFSPGLRGALERVPVNKLSLYVVSLDRCGLLGGPGRVEPLLRWERSEHFIYTINIERETVLEIVSRLRTASTAGNAMGGLVYDKFIEGARSVFAQILALAPP